MAKHDPTKQKHGMYESLNEKGASHTTPHKDLNAKAPAELNRFPIGYSNVVNKVNAKSPTTIKEIDGYKANRGHIAGEVSHMPNTASGFSEKQIPNTKPKSPHTSATGHPIVTHHHKSKSLIFHG